MATLVLDIETAPLPGMLTTVSALSPWTGMIASVALHDIERRQSVIYCLGDVGKDVPDTPLVKVRTEAEMLEDVWEGARSYDVFVTFNGRTRTFPFLLHRSMAYRVKPTISGLNHRYISKQTPPYHVDLADEFSFRGTLWPRPTLAEVCRAYDIPWLSQHAELEKESAGWFSKGEYRLSAERAELHLRALSTLYELWKGYLAPPAFLNAIEF